MMSDVENLAPNEVVVTSEMQDLKNLCTQFGLSSFGPRHAVIKRLVKQGILKASDYSLDGGSFSVKSGRKQSVPTKDSKDTQSSSFSVKGGRKQSVPTSEKKETIQETEFHKKLKASLDDSRSRLNSKKEQDTNHMIRHLPSDKGIDLLINKDKGRTKEQCMVNSKKDDTDSDSSVECLDVSDDENDSEKSDKKGTGSSSFPTQILFSRHLNPENEPSEEKIDLNKDETNKQSLSNNKHKESTSQSYPIHKKSTSQSYPIHKESTSQSYPIHKESTSQSYSIHKESTSSSFPIQKESTSKSFPSHKESPSHKKASTSHKKSKEMWVTSNISPREPVVPETSSDIKNIETKKKPVKKKTEMFVSDTMRDLMNYGDVTSDEDGEENIGDKVDRNEDRIDVSDSDASIKCMDLSENESKNEDKESDMDYDSETSDPQDSELDYGSETNAENRDMSQEKADEKSNKSHEESESSSDSDDYLTADNATPAKVLDKSEANSPFVPFGSFVTATGSAEKVKFTKDEKKVELPFVPFGSFVSSTGSPEVVKFKIDSKKDNGAKMHLDPKLGKWVNCPPEEEDEKTPKNLVKINHDVLELSDNKRTVERKLVPSGLCPGVVVVDQSIVNFSNCSENDEKMMNILSILENDNKQFSLVTRTGGDTTEEIKDLTPVKKETKETIVVLNNSKKSKKSKSKTGNNNFVAWGTFEDASGSAEKVQFI